MRNDQVREPAVRCARVCIILLVSSERAVTRTRTGRRQEPVAGRSARLDGEEKWRTSTVQVPGVYFIGYASASARRGTRKKQQRTHGRVGAGVRFGKRKRGDQLAGREPRQVLALLGLAARQQNRARADALRARAEYEYDLDFKYYCCWSTAFGLVWFGLGVTLASPMEWNRAESNAPACRVRIFLKVRDYTVWLNCESARKRVLYCTVL